jgi:hypothetical protein
MPLVILASAVLPSITGSSVALNPAGHAATSAPVNGSALVLSDASLSTAGILLITVVGIAYGGTFMLRVVTGGVPVTEFQKSFFRAGHAHAGVLVILGLLATILVDATDLDGVARTVARDGVPLAAILVSAGFFASAIGRDRTTPNRLIVLVWLGALSLTAGVLTLGVGLLTAGP